jgi:uncharacterized protein (DUF169 family)
MSGQGAYVHSIVPVIHTGECNVTLPCLGDRRRAFAQDDEVIFSTPLGKMKSLIAGLIALSDGGKGFLWFLRQNAKVQ